MSFELYQTWWIKSKKELLRLQQKDRELQAVKKPKKKREVAFKLLADLYTEYSRLVQVLDVCTDQCIQVQKVQYVRKLMDCATTRLKEIKEDLVNQIDFSEYHYIDGTLVELKLIPHDIEILTPYLKYPRSIEIQELYEKFKSGEVIYVREPEPEIEEPELDEFGLPIAPAQPPEPPPRPRTRLPWETEIEEDEEEEEEGEDDADEIQESPEVIEAQRKMERTQKNKEMIKMILQEPPPVEPTEEELKRQADIEAAINLIQTAERGRQARLYFYEKWEIFDMRRKTTTVPGYKIPAPPDPEIANPAALEIQRNWRGSVDRAEIKRREVEKRFLIGMTEPSYRPKKEFEILEQHLQLKRDRHRRRVKQYIEANLKEKERILKIIKPGVMEDIAAEIREWFYVFYQATKTFDTFPTPEQGGSILLVRGDTMTTEEFQEYQERLIQEKLNPVDKNAEKAERAKQKKKEKELKKKKKLEEKKALLLKKKNEAKGIILFSYKLGPSEALDEMDVALGDYSKQFSCIDEMENPKEKHYIEMIRDDVACEIKMELRPIVDEAMRIELHLLKEALAIDQWKAKGKKGLPPPKEYKPPPPPKKKGRKKKGGKDITANRTIEDLFQEMVDNGIIRTYPRTRLSEYFGDFSYQNYEQRMLSFDPPATLGDVRQVVTLNCILPLGVETMKARPKGVLIAGPRHSGKHVLANAIFTETECVLFDVSSTVLAGKYPGKKGMKMLVHLLTKLPRLLQPSIIFIDGAHKPFYKKVPAAEKELEPKKLGKALFKKIIKPIKPEDRVMALGITGEPWGAKNKQLKKAFPKVILIPPTDYGSVYMYWKELLMRYHAVDRNFDCSSLTQMTIGFPLPVIRTAVESVLTPKRIVQLSYKPLTHLELYRAIDEGEEPLPVDDKEYSKFVKWYGSLPLGKGRKVIMFAAELEREAAKKAAEKEAQKGGKK